MYCSDKVVIGLSVSLTGHYKLQGTSSYKGVLAWVDRVNSNGGLSDSSNSCRPVELVVYDDESSATGVENNIATLIDDDQVDIILGPYSTNLIKLATNLCHKKKRLIWNHGGASQDLHTYGFDLLVSSLTPCNEYFTSLADTTNLIFDSTLKICRVSNNKGEFSPKVSGSAVESLVMKYDQAAEILEIDMSVHDTELIFHKIQEFVPDVIVFVGTYQQDVDFVINLRNKTKIRPQLICVGAAGLDEFWMDVGHSGNLIVGPSQWESSMILDINHGPTLAEVKDNIAEDVVLDYVFMQAYGMGLIIEYCISACKTLNEQVLRQFAETADIETVFGRFKIDPQTGAQVGHRMVLVQWNNGKKYALTGVEGTWIPLGYESS